MNARVRERHAGEFDPLKALAALDRHAVAYVLIGGMAATIHGSPHVTFDLDVTPKRGKANLTRLAAALAELDAQIYVNDEEPALPFDIHASSLSRAEIWNLVTSAGHLDIVFSPAGSSGYADLIKNAQELELGEGLTVAVASLDDVIASKESAGRPKDEAVLPDLWLLRDAGR